MSDLYGRLTAVYERVVALGESWREAWASGDLAPATQMMMEREKLVAEARDLVKLSETEIHALPAEQVTGVRRLVAAADEQTRRLVEWAEDQQVALVTDLADLSRGRAGLAGYRSPGDIGGTITSQHLDRRR